jgi:hypothetical protein
LKLLQQAVVTHNIHVVSPLSMHLHCVIIYWIICLVKQVIFQHPFSFTLEGSVLLWLLWQWHSSAFLGFQGCCVSNFAAGL